MGIVVALLLGALVGWVASLILRTDSQQGAVANIVIGVLGAFVGRWFFGDLLHFGGAHASGALSIVGMLWAVLGAGVLIGMLKLIRVMA